MEILTQRAQAAAALQAEILAQRQSRILGNRRRGIPLIPPLPVDAAAPTNLHPPPPSPTESSKTSSSLEDMAPPNPGLMYQDIEIDSIKTEYHPSSGRPSVITPFADYDPGYGAVNTDVPVIFEPWYPLKSKRDYEVSRFPADHHLSHTDIDKYFANFHNGPHGHDPDITATNYESWNRIMQALASRHGEFRSTTFSCSIDDKHNPVSYTVWYRDVWEAVCEIMDDRTLGPKLVWDPVRLSKWDGAKWCPFIDEPWTAKDFWDFQCELPVDGKTLALSLYADKTKLSSFASAQGYPVIVRVLNLPVEDRNGRGVGGGQVVGWLPFPTHSNHFDSSVWATHKRVVWHSAMRYILDSIASRSRFGQSRHMPALGNQIFHIFPTILTVSADLEEQSVMGLTRGARAKHPCVVCLCPSTDLHRYGKVYPMRTTAATKERYAQMEKMEEKDKEAILKEKGERYVRSVFWGIHGFCIYRALKFDRLHVVHDGLLGQHLLPTFIQHIQALERRTDGILAGVYCAIADCQLAGFPRWRDLSHFLEGFTNVTFNDGKKFQHIMMQLSYTVHSLLTPETDEAGYILLRALRALLEFDTYVGLEVHTEDTMAAGDKAATRFAKLLEEYEQLVDVSDESDDELEEEELPGRRGAGKTKKKASKGAKKAKVKLWAFLKAHMPQHAMADILRSGASRGYNTKTGEQMHNIFKKSYQATNFKNTDGQVLRAERYKYALDVMQDGIEFYESQIKEINLMIFGEGGEHERKTVAEDMHVSVQSPNGNGAGLTTVGAMDGQASGDVAFTDFSLKLASCVRVMAQEDSTILPPGCDAAQLFRASFQIQRYASMKVSYEHQVDWRVAQDYLKANPRFYGHPRYDCLLVNGVDGYFFARLVTIFSVFLGGRRILLALVHPYSRQPHSTNPEPRFPPVTSAELKRAERRREKVERAIKIDRELRHHRVRPVARKHSQVIPLRSIVRGAVLVQDFEVSPISKEMVSAKDRRTREGLFDAPEGLKKDSEYLVADLIDSDMFLRMQKTTYLGQVVVHDYEDAS